MRIWTLHPKYLDSRGLIALWRETLLAKNVLENKTKGYKNHPQLTRFKNSNNALDSINFYLQEIYKEAISRGYDFSKDKFQKVEKIEKINVTEGQILYEVQHLKNKLDLRDKSKLNYIKSEKEIQIHPIFKKVQGSVESWEKVITNQQ